MNTATMKTTIDPVSDFRQVMETAGLQPTDVVPDGVLRRCGTESHPRSQNGAFKMFEDGRGGWYEDHAGGRGVQFWTAAGCEPMSEAEREAHQAEIKAAKAKREADQAEARAEAITKARTYLATLPPATDSNGYLLKKHVKAVSGLLQDGVDLICPVLGDDGRPVSYQRITPDGSKKFAPGCPTRGGFFAIGPKGNGGPLLLAEGLATALSCFEATGWPCLVAFNTGNLEAVARMARQRYPERKLILAADNDTETEARTGKNPGIESAQAAALAVNGLLAMPKTGALR